MKRLTLVRHAQAEDALAGQSDFERALTRKGSEDAAEMSRRLKQRKLAPQIILASTALRAQTTAEIFARTLRCSLNPDDRLYTAGPNDYFKILQGCDDRYTDVLLVAHNPTITEFADKIAADRPVEAMPTCSVATLQLPISRWADLQWKSGLDLDLDYPARIA
jgi:phosphohistidine phosphatase